MSSIKTVSERPHLTEVPRNLESISPFFIVRQGILE